MTERDDLIFESAETDVFASFEGDLPASPRRSSPWLLARRYLPAVVAFVAVLLIWEGLTRLFGVESFVLSKPSEILASFVETLTMRVARCRSSSPDSLRAPWNAAMTAARWSRSCTQASIIARMRSFGVSA